MPREDERFRNLSPRHPQYCTCVECVERRNKRREAPNPVKAAGGLVGKLAGVGKSVRGKKRGKSGGSGKSKGRSKAVAEPVRKHKPDCDCATCTLLRTI